VIDQIPKELGAHVAELFNLKLFTLEKVIYEGSAVSMVAPGVDGYFGVLAHHAPLIAALKPGRLIIRDERGGESVYAVSGGFVEVSGNSVVLLADSVEKAVEG
jgi:F-type H+-transporting ATPase subunit epsilon